MGNNIRVLLVDDDKGFREPMADWLRRKGYVVDAVANGLEAIAYVRQMQGQYDAALLDQTLVEGPDGIETMKRIHVEYPELLVIIITGWGEREVGVRALREGAYRYISKSVDSDEIDILIQSIVELREMQRQLELTEREREWLRTLLEVTQAMQSRTDDIRSVLNCIGEAAKKLTRAHEWGIYLSEPWKARLAVNLSTEKEWTPLLKNEIVRLSDLIMKSKHPEYIPDTAQDRRISPAVVEFGIRSLWSVPIGQVGVLNVCSQQPHQFGKEDWQVLKMLASQADVAIQNAILLEERKHRVNELQKLREVGTLMAEAVHLPEVLRRIADGVKALLHADSASIWPYDAVRKRFEIEMVCKIGISDEDFSKIKQQPRPGGTADTIMQAGFKFVDDVEKPEYTFIGQTSRSFFRDIGVKCFAGLVLKVGEEPVGMLYLNYNQLRFFSKEEEATLRTFATEAALAIKKARLYQQVQQILQHLEVTADFMRLGNIDEVLRGVAKGVAEALNCDVVTLYQYDESEKAIIDDPVTLGLNYEAPVRLMHNLGPGTTLGKILEMGEHYADQAATDPIMQGEFLARENVCSSAGIALRVGEHTVGILFVNYRTSHHFTEEDRRLVRTFATQAAIAIYNAELYEKEKKISAHLRSLYTAGKMSIAPVDKDQVLNAVLDIALEFTGLSGGRPLFANFQMYDAERDEIIFTHARPDGVLPELQQKIGKRISLKEGYNGRIGVIGKAIKTRQTQWVPDVTHCSDYIPYVIETRSEIAVPFIVEDRVIGVLNVEHLEVNGLDQKDKEALEMLVTQAVVAVQKIEQLEELRNAQGLLAARTALAWMGIASSTWRHEINKYAATISDDIWLIRRKLPQRLTKLLRPLMRKVSDIEEYLHRIEKLLKLIREIPINAPLSAEEGVESLEVNALMQERVFRLLEAREKAEFNLEWILELPDTARVRVSREWLRRAIDLLVQNSFEAMEEISPRTLIVKTFHAGQRAEIRLKDSGNGIPPEIVNKLLREPIPKKKGERGSGMGLLLAQLIVQTYKGDIRMISTGPQGTEMALSLPLEGD
jgi:GAF domain-containing protein